MKYGIYCCPIIKLYHHRSLFVVVDHFAKFKYSWLFLAISAGVIILSTLKVNNDYKEHLWEFFQI
jgi:hypothetical protein